MAGLKGIYLQFSHHYKNYLCSFGLQYKPEEKFSELKIEKLRG